MLHIKPILATFMRRKLGVALIVLQIAVTMAIIVNAISTIQQRNDKIDRPTGMDITNVITFDIIFFDKVADMENKIRLDTDMLRSLPGVISTSYSNQVPLSFSGDSSGFASSLEAVRAGRNHGAGVFTGQHTMAEILGLKLKEGRFFTEEEVIYSNEQVNPRLVLLTDDLAKRLFPNGDALGKTVYWYSEAFPLEVIGIIERLGSRTHSSIFYHNVVMPMVPLRQYMRVMLRVHPDAKAEVMRTVEKALLSIDNKRVINNITTIEQFKADAYASDRAMSIILWAAVCLLIIVTSLAIVGMMSFSVEQRTRQIGTRRALGANQHAILGYFITENVLMSLMGLTIGSALALALNNYLVQSFQIAPVKWYYFPVAVLLVLASGIIAVWLPARQAAAISPAVATQNV